MHFLPDNIDEFDRQIEDILWQSEELYAGLEGIAGVTPYPSEADFIYFSCNFDTDRIYQSLKASFRKAS